LEERQRKAFTFNGSHHGRSTYSRPIIDDIMMHDVNIEEMTKVRNSSFSLVTLLMIKLILHL